MTVKLGLIVEEAVPVAVSVLAVVWSLTPVTALSIPTVSMVQRRLCE